MVMFCIGIVIGVVASRFVRRYFPDFRLRTAETVISLWSYYLG